MTILFVGNEPSDFVRIGSPDVRTDTSFKSYDPAMSRGSIWMTNNTNVGATTGTAIIANFETNHKVWVGFLFSKTNPLGTRPFFQCFDSADGTGFPHFYLSGTGVNDSVLRLTLVETNGAETLVASSTEFFSTWTNPHYYSHKVDICIEPNRLRVYGMGHKLILDYAGNVRRAGSSSTGFNRVAFSNNDLVGAQTGINEVVIATTSTRTMRLKTLVPDGIAAQGSWTGAIADINEFVLNTTTVAQSVTEGDTLTVSLGDIAAGAAVRAVAVSSQLSADGSNPGSVALGYAFNGETPTYKAEVSPSASFAPYQAIFELNSIANSTTINGMSASLRTAGTIGNAVMLENGDTLVYEDGSPVEL